MANIRRKRKIVRITVALLVSFPAFSAAQQIAFQEYAVSVPLVSSLYAVAVGPDGAIWGTDPINGHINRVTTAGDVSSYSVAHCVPPFGCGNFGIAGGPDGAVWFTNWSQGVIGRMTTAGVITGVYHVPGDGLPWGITAGPDGALWFCEESSGGNQIGRITTAGRITMFHVPYPASEVSQPQWITVGPDGALWFSENDYVGRITTRGAITVYPVTVTANESLGGITAGPDGALWFGAGSAVGRITTSGVVSYYPLPSGYNVPVTSIAAGPDGALWFTEGAGASISRITTAGSFSQYQPPLFGKVFFGGYGFMITAGPGGTLWFAAGSAMGEIVFPTANMSVNPTFGYYGTSLAFNGSGFTPGETVNIYGAGIGSPVVASAIADSSGSITATGLTPQACNGGRVFLATGQTSGKLGAPSFGMGASLIATPNTGPPGTTVTIQGYGFSQFLALNLAFGNDAVGGVTTSRHGSFGRMSTVTFTIPVGTPPGTYWITANPSIKGYPAAASASFVVQ
jgi:virginiamycin B lyase